MFQIGRRLVLLALLAVPAAALTQGADHTKDAAAIQAIIANWDRGWKDFDAALATKDYATDADWTNAFGRPRKGRAAIEEFLGGQFALPQMRSRTSTPSTVSIRFVKPDVAVVTSDRQTSGQRSASGATYPVRKTHDLRVFMNDQGRWWIVSHIIMDEKEVVP